MKLSFHGAVAGVTGSCYLLETQNHKIVVDCGMFQGKNVCETQECLRFAFSASSIDAVLVTHAHLDHTGRIPLLVKNGFTGKVFSTTPTKELALYVLEDSVRLMAEQAEKEGEDPLYSFEHVEQAGQLFSGVNYHTRFEVVPGVHATFYDAGHILGSAFLHIEVEGQHTKDGEMLRLVFSGDIGNDAIPILPETEDMPAADVLVVESTYGNRDHVPVEQRKGELMSVMKRVIGRGGTLLIPAFSIERTQELLYALDELADAGEMPQVPVFLDSPLGIKTTHAYRKFSSFLQFDRASGSADGDFFTFPRLKETLTVDQSKGINNHRGPKVIIAGSGMMNGGRILHHLLRYLSDSKSAVLIVGFQAPGTLGRRIQEGAKKVKIYGKEVEVEAEIFSLDSFSAHADRAKLVTWMKTNPQPFQDIFLTHGDPEVKLDFEQYIRKNGVKGAIHIPEKEMVKEW